MAYTRSRGRKQYEQSPYILGPCWTDRGRPGHTIDYILGPTLIIDGLYTYGLMELNERVHQHTVVMCKLTSKYKRLWGPEKGETNPLGKAEDSAGLELDFGLKRDVC